MKKSKNGLNPDIKHKFVTYVYLELTVEKYRYLIPGRVKCVYVLEIHSYGEYRLSRQHN